MIIIKKEIRLTSEETHACPEGFNVDKCTKLVMGTFPPRKENEKDPFFFYSSGRNLFWNTVDDIKNTRLKLTGTVSKKRLTENLKAKKQLMEKEGIGFLDAFTRIKRFDKVSSASKDIVPTQTVFGNGTF